MDVTTWLTLVVLPPTHGASGPGSLKMIKLHEFASARRATHATHADQVTLTLTVLGRPQSPQGGSLGPLDVIGSCPAGGFRPSTPSPTGLAAPMGAGGVGLPEPQGVRGRLGLGLRRGSKGPRGGHFATPPTGIRGGPWGPFLGPKRAPGGPPKKGKKCPFLDPCGAKSRGSGGAPPTHLILLRNQRRSRRTRAAAARTGRRAVSYTHLTLPTIYSV